MMSVEPTFVASRDGLCGFVLVVEDGQVDAYTPSGNLLGVFSDRIEAVEAVVQNAALRRPAVPLPYRFRTKRVKLLGFTAH
jgi:hypothetical protein